jgi:hypothetical protein
MKTRVEQRLSCHPLDIVLFHYRVVFFLSRMDFEVHDEDDALTRFPIMQER